MTRVAKVRLLAEEVLDKPWFEMRVETRRRLANAAWVSLKQSHEDEIGTYGELGFRQAYEGAHTVAIKLEHRDAAEDISWSSSFEDGAWSAEGLYKPADVRWGEQGVEIGVALVLEQSFDGAEKRIWTLNQDLVFALGLLREGDVWVRPSEGYEEVVRLDRDSDGRPINIRIRAEYLRDYLAARGMALRVCIYRSRKEVVEDASFVDWSEEPTTEERDGGRFEGRAIPIHEGGHLFGASTAVFQMSRTDVDTEAEVPIMDAAGDEGVETKQWSFQRDGRKLTLIEGEFWRDDWLEPAQASPRVRRDHVLSGSSFIVDGSGERQSADALDFEDIGRWLWFSPDVVTKLLARRGGRIKWHTAETGSVWIAGGTPVHFGINSAGLVNVYAYDVARLGEWERRIWAGSNVAPDGGVSDELTAAQVRTRPASTQAPEAFLAEALGELNAAFLARYGMALIKPHDDHEEILQKCHRFRVSDRASLWALAKDVARLTADSFDVAALRKVLALSKDERLGTLKGIERTLEPLIGKDEARKLLSPLVGIYELRLGDAHLPSSKTNEALALIQIDVESNWLDQGRDLLGYAVTAIYLIAGIYRQVPVSAAAQDANARDDK